MTLFKLLEERNDLPLTEAINRHNQSDLTIRDLYLVPENEGYKTVILSEIIGTFRYGDEKIEIFEKDAHRLPSSMDAEDAGKAIAKRLLEYQKDAIEQHRCLASQVATDQW